MGLRASSGWMAATAVLAALALTALLGGTARGAAAAIEAARATPPASAVRPFRAEVRVAHVGGQRIAWYERGSGPPLLMAIGTGSTMAEWDPALLELLARRRRLVLFDYPGIGRSSRLHGPAGGTVGPPAPAPAAAPAPAPAPAPAHAPAPAPAPAPARPRIAFAGLADTTARFLTAIGVERADVLGWSMGGFVAQQLAIRHPGVVRRLVLAGTNPGGSESVLGPPADQRIDSDPDPSDADVLRVLYPRTRAGQAEGRAFLRRLEDASERGAIPDDFDVPAATVGAQVRAEDPWLRSDANARALGGLRIPTLVTGGRDDVVVPPANARLLARLIPHARLRLLPGGHAFLFGERVRFARIVQRFLGRR